MTRLQAWRRSDSARQGDRVITTAYSERLNTTFREHLTPLVRHTLTLHEGMLLVGTVYNFCTPHESWDLARKTTPAMAAGITDHCWTWKRLLAPKRLGGWAWQPSCQQPSSNR
jgi:hypothetical protein